MSIRWRTNPDGKTKTAYLDITVRGFKRVRISTGIKSDMPNARQLAQELHDLEKTKLWRQAKLGEKPRHLWPEAVVRWISEHQHKRAMRVDKGYLRWLDPHLRDRYLDTIDRDTIEQIMAIKEAEDVAPATVNRHAAIVRSILNAAANEWGWINVAPKIRMRREENDRITWMTQDEAYGILLRELAATAPHLYDAAEFTLQTGFRDNNAASLQWDQISFEHHAAYVYRTKNGQPLGTPLNSIAMAVLERRRGIHPVYVFTWKGKPLTRFNNSAWRKALARTLAKIGEPLPERLEGFTWHSLRHTWASWAMQNGVPVEKLQLLGGWKTLTMAMRYAHLATEHLAPHSERIAESVQRSKAASPHG